MHLWQAVHVGLFHRGGRAHYVGTLEHFDSSLIPVRGNDDCKHPSVLYCGSRSLVTCGSCIQGILLLLSAGFTKFLR